MINYYFQAKAMELFSLFRLSGMGAARTPGRQDLLDKARLNRFQVLGVLAAPMQESHGRIF
jgi:hypothetical protein